MSKKITIISSLLALSVMGNAYLFKLVLGWQDAWLDQMLTTSEIENLYRKSSADTSLEGIKAQAEKEGREVKIVPLQETDILWSKGDKKVLLLGESRLYFIDKKYVGSKANLPSNISPWRFGQNEL